MQTSDLALPYIQHPLPPRLAFSTPWSDHVTVSLGTFATALLSFTQVASAWHSILYSWATFSALQSPLSLSAKIKGSIQHSRHGCPGAFPDQFSPALQILLCSHSTLGALLAEMLCPPVCPCHQPGSTWKQDSVRDFCQPLAVSGVEPCAVRQQ